MLVVKWRGVLLVVMLFLLQVETAQAGAYVDALSTANDALIYAAGDGYGDVEALSTKLQRLRHVGDLSEADARQIRLLAEHLEAVVKQVRSGGEFPWSAAGEIAVAIRGVVRSAEDHSVADRQLVVEFILIQYLYRSFFGTFELAPELQESMVSKSEKVLLQELEGQFPLSDGAKKTSAWRCMSRAIANLDADAAQVRSTPLVFFKCARNLTE